MGALKEAFNEQIIRMSKPTNFTRSERSVALDIFAEPEPRPTLVEKRAVSPVGKQKGKKSDLKAYDHCKKGRYVAKSRAEMIMELRAQRIRVDLLTPFQLRINGLLDVFPVSGKFHNIKTNQRGFVPGCREDAKFIKHLKEMASAHS